MPVNGTSVARRGAELALAIAAVTGAPVKMLYVAGSAATSRATPSRIAAGKRC